MDELQTMFRQSPQALRGRLRVDMPVGVARRIVIPALPALLDAHPELESNSPAPTAALTLYAKASTAYCASAR